MKDSVHTVVSAKSQSGAIDAPTQLELIAIQAFTAGFNASGEGWNGEYPLSQHSRTWLSERAASYARDLERRTRPTQDGEGK